MSGTLESRTERLFMEIEGRMRKHDAGKPPADRFVPVVEDNYIDEKINNYEFYLNKAYENAPCAGCKKLVESAIVGVRIFKLMDKDNLKREDITEDKIQRIKEQVRGELKS
jgi:hypothetical protein